MGHGDHACGLGAGDATNGTFGTGGREYSAGKSKAIVSEGSDSGGAGSDVRDVSALLLARVDKG